MATLQLNFFGNKKRYISHLINSVIVIYEDEPNEENYHDTVIIDINEWENLKSFIDNQIANKNHAI